MADLFGGDGAPLATLGSLAWLFLGERLTWQEIIGMALAGIGALIVQLRR